VDYEVLDVNGRDRKYITWKAKDMCTSCVPF